MVMCCVALWNAMSSQSALAAVDTAKDFIKNGFFEMRGKEGVQAWKLPKGWRIERGFGRNGGGGLIFETSQRLAEKTYAEQIFDVEPGRVYDLKAWVEGQLDSPKGIFLTANFLNEKGDVVGYARTISHGANKKWGMVSARTKRLPDSARKVRVRIFVPEGSVGRAYFDDIAFTLHKVDPVTTLCSSCYRNETVAGEAPVRFFAGIDLNDSNCAKDDAEIVFSFDAANGRREKRKASAFEGNDVFIDIDPEEMKLGEQEIAVEVFRKDGVEIGKKTLKFSRLEQYPKRPAWIDGNRRLMLNGKPFFPIAVYCTRAESNIVELVGKSPFNTLMAYQRLDWKMLDWCKTHGLMASIHVGDLTMSEEHVARKVKSVKDHPALLAWLMNDERPLSMLSRIHTRYRTIRENDDGHPAWAVLYQVDDMRGYLGTCDAIGSDPYPIPHASVKLAHDWAEKTRKGIFGALPMWQTVQIFDWAAYKTKAVPGTDVSKYRATTLAEMKIMAWLQIVNGANALFMYSYNPLVKMDWRDSFEKKWAEVCECAGEIAKISDILLSLEKAPEVTNVPKGLAVRTWSKDCKKYLLVCNKTGIKLKTKMPLPHEFSGTMSCMFGNGVTRDGNVLAIDFAIEGYAFLSFER
jgi:hypothetical protein